MRRVKKRYGVSPAPAPTPELARPANANVPRPSRKKSRFSGKNRSKRVRLTCCSSTSTCEKSVLTVRSAVRLCVMPNFRSPPMRPVGSLDTQRRHGPIGGHARERVRLQFQVAAARGHLQAFEGARRRDLEDAAEGGERARHRGEVRPLVLPSDDPPEVDPPRLVSPGLIAQRLERNRHLDGPSAVEAPGLHVPHGVPVVVGRALIGDLPVGEPADRVGVEDVAVALVVEGVEEHREVVVLPQLRRVAPHLVGDAPLRVRFAAPRRDVDVVVVEEDPRLGLLGGRLALVRLLLHEVR